MNKKKNLATFIKRSHYEGSNPFTHSQARSFTSSQIVKEFYPTSTYWTRFNDSNEILIGTRGSGKTILLRMLSFSLYRSLPDFDRRVELVGPRFLGLYIPLRLRILNELKDDSSVSSQRIKFSFLFNCVAAGSFLEEIIALLNHQISDPWERLEREREIIDGLLRFWAFPGEVRPQTLRDLIGEIDQRYEHFRRTGDLANEPTVFVQGLLEPIISVLKWVTEKVGLVAGDVTWIACFDEAEYLSENLQRVLNTVMRSTTGGLAIKVATLPLEYANFETEQEGVFVHADGHDFRFVSIDHDWSGREFAQLTDNIVANRLRCTGLFDDLESEGALDAFVGEASGRDLTSLYRTYFKASEEQLEADLLAAIRCKGGIENNSSKMTIAEGNLKKFRPVYILRRLHEASRKGNTVVPWLAGATMVRRLSGGNVRRFIQICDALFQQSTKFELSPKNQHRILIVFCNRALNRSASVYKEGFLLREFIRLLCGYLYDEMHRGNIKDVGVEFSISSEMMRYPKIRDVLKAGVAYAYFTTDDQSLFDGIGEETRFYLAHFIAGAFWIPMRAGSGTHVSGRAGVGRLLIRSKILSEDQTQSAIRDIQLDLFENQSK